MLRLVPTRCTHAIPLLPPLCNAFMQCFSPLFMVRPGKAKQMTIQDRQTALVLLAEGYSAGLVWNPATYIFFYSQGSEKLIQGGCDVSRQAILKLKGRGT